MNNYRCLDCNNIVNDNEFDDMLSCPKCGGRLEEGLFTKPKHESRQSHNQSSYESSHEEHEDIIFRCYFCDKMIQVSFPIKSTSFSCASCRSKYDIQCVGKLPKVYLILPKDEKWAPKASPKQPNVPEEVKKALNLFDLNETVAFDEVKARYRKCMTEYHPDKVAHLGVDLRRFAEEKSKRYNAAYTVVQHYFKNNNNNGT